MECRHALVLMRQRGKEALCISPTLRAPWQQQNTCGRVFCSCTSLRQAHHAAQACWPDEANGALHAGCRRPWCPAEGRPRLALDHLHVHAELLAVMLLLDDLPIGLLNAS